MNYAPYFVSALVDTELVEEETQVIYLAYNDLNSRDNHTVSMDTNGGSFIKLVESNSAYSIEVEPKLGHAGSYEVSVTVTDNDFWNLGV